MPELLQLLIGVLGVLATGLLGWIKHDLAAIRSDMKAERQRVDEHAERLAVLEERTHGAR